MAFLRSNRTAAEADAASVPTPRDGVDDGFASTPGVPAWSPAAAAPSASPSASPSATNRFFAKKVKGVELMNFSRQLAAFIRAGIPILDALDLLTEDCPNPTLRMALTEMSAGLRNGEPLSEALDRHPKVFATGYRAMLRSAELTGNLDTVLDRLAHYLERDIEAKSKVRSALVYPGVVAVMASGVITLLVVFVLPKFEVFFTSFNRELPLPTRMLISTANFLSSWYWVIAVGLALVCTALIVALRNESVRGNVDRWLLRVPVLGVTIRYAIVERFARVLSSMLQAGVTLPEAMAVATAGTNNRFVRRTLADARDAMMRGEGIADPLAQSGLLPRAASQMIRVGESTGYLDTQLDAVATFYERELDYRIKKLTSLFEPLVLIVMGGIVGFVALALVSAMYGIYRTS